MADRTIRQKLSGYEFRFRALIQSSHARLILVIRVGLIVACTPVDPRSDNEHIVAWPTDMATVP
jgi:hypothetical protein